MFKTNLKDDIQEKHQIFTQPKKGRKKKKHSKIEKRVKMK